MNEEHLKELEQPRPQVALTPEEILMGPQIDPKERVRLYDEDKFEEFILEWAFLCLQKPGEYVGVRRFGGSSDLGRDVVGYLELPLKASRFDIYQCKHYKAPITPSEIWPEFAKLCVFTHEKRFPTPRYYFVVAPQDVGPTLGGLIDEPEKLRAELQAVWGTKCSRAISKGITYPLEGELLAHVQAFPFEIVRCKPIHEVIDEFSHCGRYVGRFGGGLKPFPPDEMPPHSIHTAETRYVEQLLAAYSDETGQNFNTVADLTGSKFEPDLHRQRERFYSAETLRRFARDNQPSAASYEDITDQMYNGVIDCVLRNFHSGYQRMLETMTTSAQIVISNHPLRSYLKPQSKQGVCHQLANDDRIYWVQNGE